MSYYFLVDQLARVQRDERLREAEQERGINLARKSQAEPSRVQTLFVKITRGT